MDAPAQVHDGPEEACMKNTAPAPTPSTIMDIVGMVIFLVLSIAAAWYGWKLGNQWAPGFWTKIQNYGLSLGNLIQRLHHLHQTFYKRYFHLDYTIILHHL